VDFLCPKAADLQLIATQAQYTQETIKKVYCDANIPGNSLQTGKRLPADLNSAAAALGLAPQQRAVILHADDIGMCHATIPALAELTESGSLSSASVMVPCPWFGEVARYCKSNPALDMGVHLTLTSEWSTYRWAPISTMNRATGMIDGAGYFHAARDFAQKASPEAVYIEMRAQLRRAQQAGIDVTHVDAHMFTALQPPLMNVYLRLGIEERLPVLAWTRGPGALPSTPNGILPLDAVRQFPSGNPAGREQQFRELVDHLPAGVTHLLIHPAVDTPELRQIVTAWRERVADYEFFRGKAAAQYLERAGVTLVGYRALRDALRRLAADASA
jgi:hypothetical protein